MTAVDKDKLLNTVDKTNGGMKIVSVANVDKFTIAEPVVVVTNELVELLYTINHIDRVISRQEIKEALLGEISQFPRKEKQL